MRVFSVLCVLPLLLHVSPAHAQTTALDRGPNGLEAWTDDHHTKEFRTNTEPFGIIVARNGKVIRRIGQRDGGPFFWNVMLLPDGKRIAYQSGPFHFVMTCTLMDIATGHHLEDISCFTEDEIDAAPEWVKQLLAKDRKPTASESQAILRRAQQH